MFRDLEDLGELTLKSRGVKAQICRRNLIMRRERNPEWLKETYRIKGQFQMFGDGFCGQSLSHPWGATEEMN